jgi:hypothetical protein
MRLLKDIPEIEVKIANGSLNLTNIGFAHTAFKAEAKKSHSLNKEEKLEFLSRIENKSTRETQKLVADEFGKETLIRETVKPVTKTISLLSLPASDELIEHIEAIKGLLAHSYPGITTAELYLLLAKEKLEEMRKQKLGSAKGLSKKVAAPRKCDGDAESSVEVQVPKAVSEVKRYINATTNRELWARDQSKCTNCGSTYALERDHRVPFGMGGQTNIANLRLLCRNCNQRAAIEHYGIKKMSRYFKERQNSYSA